MRDRVGMGQSGVGWGELGVKSLTHPRPAPWYRAKILPYPHPTTFVRREKTYMGQSREGLVKRGEGKLSSLSREPLTWNYFILFFI